jgi:hypothetical protein
MPVVIDQRSCAECGAGTHGIGCEATMFALSEEVRRLPMSRRVMRLTFVGLLALTWLLGVVGAPSAVRGANDDSTFSGAETVLSQSERLAFGGFPSRPDSRR